MTLSFAKTARACIDAKAKPPGSLGVLEHWAVRCGHANSEAQRHLLDIAGQHVVQWPLCNLAVCVVLSYIIVILLNNYTVTLHGYDVLRPCVGVYVPARLAALQHTVRPQIQGARLLVFAADHGITKTIPDVSAYPRSVTPAMFAAIAQGQAASNALAAANDCGVILTDVGVDADVSHICSKTATVLHRKVSRDYHANSFQHPINGMVYTYAYVCM